MHTAIPMINATWLPPLRESLPNRVMTAASKPMSTTKGMAATRGWGLI